jgi:hypothetical protein
VDTPRVSPEDVIAVLHVYAAATEPMAVDDVCTAINSPPAAPDARTREHKAWTERQMQLMGAVLSAHQSGHLEETVAATGRAPGRSRITAAGRERLGTAEHR